MLVLDELLKIKQSLEQAEREKAMTAVMQKIYYEPLPSLFPNEYTLNDFIKANALDVRAIKWLLKNMYHERLTDALEPPIALTDFGGEKLR